MADFTPFVDFGDYHGALEAADRLVHPGTGLPFLTAADGLRYYANIATAIADTANLALGQNIIIGGGDNGSTGYTNADAGIWQVTNAPVAVVGDLTKRLDVYDHASEIQIADVNSYYASTNVEGALNEVGDKQMAFKLADTSMFALSVGSSASTLNVDTVISALQISNTGTTDADGSGDTITAGIIVNAKDATPHTIHKLPIRDAVTKDVIDDGANNEVYARLEHDAGAYILKFYSNVPGTGETAYTFPSATTIDLAYVWVSQDFMKLPPMAGITESAFFGDQGGLSGTIADENIITNSPAFTGLLIGQDTQEKVNNRVDKLGTTAAGEGASLVGIQDADGYFTGASVEAALTELYEKIENHQVVRDFETLAAATTQAALDQDWQVGDIIAITGPGADADERGLYKINTTAPNGAFIGANLADYTKVVDISHTASEVAYSNTVSGLTATDVQAAIDELSTGLVNSQSVFDYLNLAAAAAAQGTDSQKVGDYVIILGDAGNEDESGIWQVTALTGVVGNYVQVLDKSNAATEVSYDNSTSGATGTTVQAVIDEILDTIANVNGHHDFANLTAAVAAANDTWLIGDYLYISGDVGNETQRGVWKITANNNSTNPGSNPADYTKVLDISHTASEIPIVDAGGLLVATNVEAALQELAAGVTGSQYVHTYGTLADAVAAQATDDHKLNDIVVIAGTTPAENERGVYEVSGLTAAAGDYTKVLDISHTAAEVLISNGGGASFTGTTTQAALDELLAAIGGTSSTIRNYSSNVYVADNDTLVTAIGKLDAAIAAASLSYIESTTYIAGEALTLTTGPKLVAMTSTASTVELANASSTGTNVEIAGFAHGTADAATNDPVAVVTDGVLSGFTGLTAGAVYYANPAVEGGITSTVPNTVGQWIVSVGVAKSATELIVRIGEAQEIVPAMKALGVNVWKRDTSATASTGIGETGFTMEVGDIFVDNDATVQNPTNSSTGRYNVYVVRQQWVGAGTAAVTADFHPVTGKLMLLGRQS